MGGSGGFPIDLVLFGLIAAFLVLRLRSILGKRTGYEHPPKPIVPADAPGRGRVIGGRAEPVPSAASAHMPDPASPAGQALLGMQALDRNFVPAGFLAGAEKAFTLVVTAFAAGDRSTLRNLLADEAFNAFSGAIAAREAAHQHQRTEIKSFGAITIVGAALAGSVASIDVRFVSDQINLTLDSSQSPVAGTDAVTEIIDLWSFERDLSKPDPVWRLVSARSV
ncbi:MAG: Tim44 domain-containing protein [Acetobacteraceae bacterium]|nr:Tim44 domain-containing protein [Acetobacteraceae bacterium]MSP29689.1 Tim44 domain-containing protein [Acetobacteraceae bacterium]